MLWTGGINKLASEAKPSPYYLNYRIGELKYSVHYSLNMVMKVPWNKLLYIPNK